MPFASGVPVGPPMVLARDKAEEYRWLKIGIEHFYSAGVLLFHQEESDFFTFINNLRAYTRCGREIPKFYRYKHYGQWLRWFQRVNEKELLREFREWLRGSRSKNRDHDDLILFYVETVLRGLW